MNKWLNRNRYLLIFSFIISGVFLYFNGASAWSLDDLKGALTSALTNPFKEAMLALVYNAFYGIGLVTSWTAKMLDIFLHFRVFEGIPVIEAIWKIMRNFANLFFILALIVMAFATIFDVAFLKGYDVKSMLIRLIIAALLINFSLVIGQTVIKAIQIPSDIMLTAIGNVGTYLGDVTQIAKLIPADQKFAGAAAAGVDFFSGTFVMLIFSGILLFILLFSFLVALIFAIIRIPIIWLLLIISPLAWIAYIFPTTRKHFSKWWSTFIAWNIFLPLFLLVLYFGLYILTVQNTLLADPSFGATLPLGSIQGSFTGVLSSFTFSMLFTYILVAMILIGGPVYILKMSIFAGSGVAGAAGGIRKWASGLPVFRYGPAAGQAAGNIRKQLDASRQEKIRKQADIFEEQFGKFVPGYDRGLLGSKEFTRKSDKHYEDVKNLFNSGKIDMDGIAKETEKYSAADPKGYAVYRLAAEEGGLKDDRLEKAVHELRRRSPYAANELVQKAVKSGSVSGKTVKKLAQDSANPLFLRRELYKHISTEPKIAKDFTQSEFDTAVKDLGGGRTGPGKNFIKGVAKFRPDLATEHTMAQSLGPTGATHESIMRGYLTDPKDIVNMPLEVWGTDAIVTGTPPTAVTSVGGYQPFIESIFYKLHNPAVRHNVRAKYRSRLEDLLNNSPDPQAVDKLNILRKL